MRVVASIQARMGSTRLPGKVLADLCGRPMLLRQVDRIRQSRLVDDVVVATTTSKSDEPIRDLCIAENIQYFRGSEDDVLQRLTDVVNTFDIDIHVECFGDSPLVDPQLVDEFVGYLLKHSADVDYVSSAIRTTYPPGFEVVCYKGDVLRSVNQLVPVNDPLREHGGFNATRFVENVRIEALSAPPRFTAPDTYLEVDTIEDLEVMRQVFAHFDSSESAFGIAQVLEFAHLRPELFEQNQRVERRWKAFREES